MASKKKQTTAASAVELDESDLDQAQGGGMEMYLKISTVPGESVDASFVEFDGVDGESLDIRKLNTTIIKR